MAPSNQLSRVSDAIGPGASAVSSVLFLVKSPTCQSIAWGGVCLDTFCSSIQTGLLFLRLRDWVAKFSCCGNTSDTSSKLLIPPTSTIPTKPRTDRGPEVVPGDDEDKRKRKRLVVTALQDALARALETVVDRIIQELRNCPNGVIFTRNVVLNPGNTENVESMCSILIALKVAVNLIVHGRDFPFAMLVYQNGTALAFTNLTAKWEIILADPAIDNVQHRHEIELWARRKAEILESNASLHTEMSMGGEEV